MKFLIDAQLPWKLKSTFRRFGHDAIHTLDLPLKNQTADSDIEIISVNEKRVVVTKDTDFIHSFILSRKPYKLLLISMGNISNVELEDLLVQNMEELIKGFKKFNYIELDHRTVTFHK